MRPYWLLSNFLLLVATPAIAQRAPFPEFKHHDINPEAGVGLAITGDDINGDGRLDIVGVSSRDVAWYENPSWERHFMAESPRGSTVCIAGTDLDGDGKTEFALGADWQFNNTESGGALYLLRRGGDPSQPWQVTTLLNEEPTLHRIRWADVDGDGKPELIVAPLKGRDSTPPDFTDNPVKLFLLRPGADPSETPWTEEIIDESLHVMHNIWPMPIPGTSNDAVLAASYEGITAFTRQQNGTWRKDAFASGLPGEPPESGAGEIKISTAGPFQLATVEPWHGNRAVLYTLKTPENVFVRRVLDDSLAEGHAVWWADFDADGVDEVLVGFRGKAGPRELPGLNVYDLHHDASGEHLSWTKHVIDDGGMATEDALAADINGDGRPDIVAYGRATRNIKYYENLGESIGNSE